MLDSNVLVVYLGDFRWRERMDSNMVYPLVTRTLLAALHYWGDFINHGQFKITMGQDISQNCK